MNDRVVCVMSVGAGKYRKQYELVRDNLMAYAKKCHADFRFIDDYIDKDKKRDIYSQKLLIPDYLREYEQVLFLDLDIKHLSIYSLQIEENSIFGRQNLKPVDEDIEADMYELICRTMEKAGYLHYEISSFCKPGYHSKHNLAYWQDEDFIGLGCGASGKENNVRYDNTRSLKTYIESGANPYIYEETQKDKAFNAIMMALRTTFGLDIQKWNQRFDQDFIKKYQSILDKYHDVLKLENGILYPSREAMEILNTILVDFLLID